MGQCDVLRNPSFFFWTLEVKSLSAFTVNVKDVMIIFWLLCIWTKYHYISSQISFD